MIPFNELGLGASFNTKASDAKIVKLFKNGGNFVFYSIILSFY